MKVNIEGHIWLSNSNGLHLGRGKIKLLELIMQEGSIAKAAQSMQMSYRKAWALIDQINNLTDEVLVEKTAGGAKGGQTVVTKKGMQYINHYKKVHEAFQVFIASQSKLKLK